MFTAKTTTKVQTLEIFSAETRKLVATLTLVLSGRLIYGVACLETPQLNVDHTRRFSITQNCLLSSHTVSHY